MKLTQMSQNQLLETLATCPSDQFDATKREIERRIKAKNNEPHNQNCDCTDCTYEEN